MSKKITVIGGSGFVGTNLCRRLKLANKEFEIIDLKMSNQFAAECKIADIRNIHTLRQNITGDVVIHLAAAHRDDLRDKGEYHRTNVEGTKNVAQVCEEKGISTIVFVSTVAVYGFAPPGTNEEGEIKPFNEYGKTKFEAELQLRSWQEQSDKSLIIVRPTVIFGEGNRGNVFNLLNQIASGRFLMVGNGKNKKSIAYVGNVVAFLEACIASDKKFVIYNYVDTPDLTMNELVSLVRLTLKGKYGTGPRIPYWLACILGYTADFVSNLSGKSFPVSLIRIKKFVSTTEFTRTNAGLEDFKAPFQLTEGITRTLHSEFIAPDRNQEKFFTE